MFPGESQTKLNYEEFLRTVKTVLNIDPHTKAKLMETLVAESTKSDFNVWKTVLKDIK